MKKSILIIVILLSFLAYSQQEKGLNYYLPQNISYNKNIPTPESILGFQVGKWHASHDKIVQYMYALAKASDRITIENRGKTYEDRPLLLLTITSPKNHNNIKNIRKEHLKLSNEKMASSVIVQNSPIVIYQGFSIHGNEASGSNAALLVAYYLAAAQGKYIDQLLDKTIILFDPVYNPDGLQRFSTWVNMHKNQNLTSDNNDREYNEEWPRGRTNHYWFDMNRDWLVAQLPESQARIRSFHKWKPNILTDHHEMGTNSTYFFQPGIPSRTHPLTPKLNQELTSKIANYHAKALDKIGSLYYTKESFDDFYYGKGSTFPDINGGIGILFEQASARGHVQQSDNGLLTFPFAIKNQVTTALSTLKAGKGLRSEILNYQRDFYKNAQKEINRDKNKAIVFGDAYDKTKLLEFIKMLKRQHISIHKLKDDIKLNSKQFLKENSYIVPFNQSNYRMIKAMFEKRTAFKDSLFYDVSAWTLPLSFGLDYDYLSNINKIGKEINIPVFNTKKLEKSNYAYLFQWNDYNTPKVLNAILAQKIRAKVAMKPFNLNGKNYDYGTIMIPVQNQILSADKLYENLLKIIKDSNVVIDATATGLANGINLGSSNFKIIKKPNVAIIVGDGITSYDAGEIWHLLDTRYNFKITKLDTRDLKHANLDDYTTIILPNSYGNDLNKSKEKLSNFVNRGGVIIGFRNSISWLNTNKFIKLKFKKSKLVTNDISFDQRQNLRGAQVIGGAIFEAKVDRSHPINFGYKKDRISLFRNTKLFIKKDSITNYKYAMQYSKDPLLSGYVSKENLKLISESLPFKTASLGKGKVIVFTDNTNFRAFWYGTNKLMMNAIFFGKMM